MLMLNPTPRTSTCEARPEGGRRQCPKPTAVSQYGVDASSPDRSLTTDQGYAY
jgi:hypothetical protein